MQCIRQTNILVQLLMSLHHTDPHPVLWFETRDMLQHTFVLCGRQRLSSHALSLC